MKQYKCCVGGAVKRVCRGRIVYDKSSIENVVPSPAGWSGLAWPSGGAVRVRGSGE